MKPIRHLLLWVLIILTGNAIFHSCGKEETTCRMIVKTSSLASVMATTSSTTSVLSSSYNPGHGNFIVISAYSAGDWLVSPNDNLWQGVSGIKSIS
jgi:hypothetical protein